MIVQERPEDHTAESNRPPGPLVIKPKKLIFYTVFVFVFFLSGIIVMLDVVPYRMNLVSLLVIPLFFLFGIRIDRVVVVFGLLTVVIFISAIVNQVSIIQLVLFLRSVIFAFLIYSLVRLVVTRDNIVTIIRLCVVVGMVQLPIMLFQIMTYDFLPSRVVKGLGVSRTDYDFGTFHFKGDAAMALFLTLLVIFLLFEHNRNYIIHYKWFVAVWLTLTVLISNAELMKLAIIFVWLVYAIRYFSVRTLIYGAISLTLIISILVFSGVFDEIIDDISHSLTSNLTASESKTKSFLSGGYGRGAAIAYYLNNKLEIIGSGPSKYYDAINKNYTRGNNGHIFTYYSEVGIIGLLLSYAIFFLIAFPIRNGHMRVRWVGVLMLITLMLQSFTTEILANVSIVLIFSIIALTYLIPEKGSLRDHVPDEG